MAQKCFSFIYMLLCILIYSTTPTKLERDNKKILSMPVDLTHMILGEHPRPTVTLIKRREQFDGESGDSQFYGDNVTSNMEVNAKNDAAVYIPARKVWSRWSKWGECSATCGSGAKSRRRLCLAGRCAPGEREEQRRPCCRQQCDLN